MQKGQFHIGFRPEIRVIRAERFAFAPFFPAGGLAEKGKADRIKQGGFPRAGVPGDEEKSVFPELGKIDGGFPRIGSEGGHFQQ